jgi:hypothetical protein
MHERRRWKKQSFKATSVPKLEFENEKNGRRQVLNRRTPKAFASGRRQQSLDKALSFSWFAFVLEHSVTLCALCGKDYLPLWN